MLSRGSVLHTTLPADRVTRRKLRMAQDSDDLFVVNIIVWVLVVILAIVALHCPLPLSGTTIRDTLIGVIRSP